MKKKVLITGISGFAGSFLAEHLLQKGSFELFGTFLTDQSLISISTIKNSINLEKIDLLDEKNVLSLIESVKPDIIFHLAALTSPQESFSSPHITITNNINAEINILEALRKHNLLNCRTLIVSSGEIYGVVNQLDLPIDEKTEIRPASPYAVSKIAQDYLGLQYFISYKIPIVRVRPFNHIGPRQSASFVVAAFAKKIAEIEKYKKTDIITVGNLKAKRDFTDVRDIVAGYLILIEKGKIGDVYNIGSGVSISISEVLNKLLALSSVSINVKEDQSLLRPSDIPDLRCDNTKIKNEIGWNVTINLDQTLKDTLDYWRNIV